MPFFFLGTCCGMDLSRHSRHFSLSGVGREGIAHQTASIVTVIGCGGLGQPAAAALGSAGVGVLRLVDADVLQESNLARLPLMHMTDIGKPKAEALAERIRLNHPHQIIETFHTSAGVGCMADLLAASCVVLDATDNWPARKLIAETCRAMNLPLVSGGALGTDGWVGTFLPSSPPLEQWLKQPDQLADSCERVGILGPLAGVIGNMMAMEALKLMWASAAPDAWGHYTNRVLYMDGRRGECLAVDMRGA